jgi:hypothetical protein
MRYEQIVVLPGCNYNNKQDKKYFLSFFKNHNFHRPKIIGVIITLPTKDLLGNNIPGTGGRNDLFFYINVKDERRFKSWSFAFGMFYWEDIFYNHEEEQYPIDFRQKYLPNI